MFEMFEEFSMYTYYFFQVILKNLNIPRKIVFCVFVSNFGAFF